MNPAQPYLHSLASTWMANKLREAIAIMEQEVWSLDETAAYLKVHQSTIYRLIKKEQLPHFRVGRDHKFFASAIREWAQHGGTQEQHEQ